MYDSHRMRRKVTEYHCQLRSVLGVDWTSVVFWVGRSLNCEGRPTYISNVRNTYMLYGTADTLLCT